MKKAYVSYFIGKVIMPTSTASNLVLFHKVLLRGSLIAPFKQSLTFF